MGFNLSNIFRRDKLKDAFERVGTPKVYKCLLNFNGAVAPTPIVLHNSLGFVPTWSRESSGVYKIDETFDGEKSFGNANTQQYSNLSDDSRFYFNNGEFDDLNQFYFTVVAGDVSGDYQVPITIEVYD